MAGEPLDLRGVGCPMNLVRVTLAYEDLAPGEVLRVRLDPGEPLDNVRRSLVARGVAVVEVSSPSGVLLEIARPPGG